MTPETLDALAQLAVAAIGLVVTIAGPILTARIHRWTGIRIEEKHMRALHEAAATWAENAIEGGVRSASEQAGQDLERYLRASVPDAVRALTPSADVLGQIAGRYIRRAADGRG